MTYKQHYCYRIDFADGFVYFGARSCSCDPAEDTSYMGSPTTHAAKWLTDIPRVKTIVSVHATRELAEAAEDELILAFWAVSKELSLNASINGANFHTQGAKLSAQHCAKLSAAMTGRVYTAETRAKMSDAATGRKLTPETRAKVAAANSRRITTDKTRAKRSKSIARLKWYTDGTTSIRLGPDAEVPEGFRRGRLCKRKQM